MLDNADQAKPILPHVRDVQRERAAAFWQGAIDAGRILRQSGAQMHNEAREKKTEERSASQTP